MVYTECCICYKLFIRSSVLWLDDRLMLSDWLFCCCLSNAVKRHSPFHKWPSIMTPMDMYHLLIYCIPAKSTRLMILLFLVSCPDSFFVICSNMMVTTVCARELVAFIWVAATVLLEVPKKETNMLILSVFKCENFQRSDTVDTLFIKRSHY